MNKVAPVREKIPSAGMSQTIFLEHPEQACCVVGSCVALTLFHRRLQVGALVHIVLPKSPGTDAPPGKFADTALPFMLRELARRGADKKGLVAKIAGGASMFGPTGPIKIGENNIVAVKKLLAEAGVHLKGEDLGGAKGRRINFDTKTGAVTVQVVGKPLKTL